MEQIHPDIKVQDFNNATPLWWSLSRALINFWAADTEKNCFQLTHHELIAMSIESIKEYAGGLAERSGETECENLIQVTDNYFNALKKERETLAKKMNGQIRAVRDHIFLRKVS